MDDKVHGVFSSQKQSSQPPEVVSETPPVSEPPPMIESPVLELPEADEQLSEESGGPDIIEVVFNHAVAGAKGGGIAGLVGGFVLFITTGIGYGIGNMIASFFGIFITGLIGGMLGGLTGGIAGYFLSRPKSAPAMPSQPEVMENTSAPARKLNSKQSQDSDDIEILSE